MRRLRLATSFIATALASPPARADDPPPSDVAIESLAFSGSGCRPGSVALNLAPDAKAFTLLFDSFVVEATTAARKEQKACDLDVKMRVPSGYAFAVATADVRGYAALSDAQSLGKIDTLLAFRK